MTQGSLALATVSGALVLMHGTSEARSFALASTEFFSLAPCRVIDTRLPDGPRGGPALVAGADRAFPLSGVCGIPPESTAISVNIAVTGATLGGNLRLHPGGTAVPLVSSVNYAAGQTRSNNAVVSLNAAGELAAFVGAAAGTVHLVLDVNGYFAPAVPSPVGSTTTLVLTSGTNPSLFGAPLTFTATVTGTAGTPTGTVTFNDGVTAIGSPVALSAGAAVLAISTLSVGAHSLTATYSGDSTYLTSTSTPGLTQTVNPLVTTSAQIEAARAAPDGGGLSLPIDGATVTYMKPGLGADPVGFTIQADTIGPALFVAVDPATLAPSPTPGDIVSFTITSMATSGQLRMATAVTGFNRLSTGANIDALVQNISTATDVVAAIGTYESELVDVAGVVTGPFAAAGASFEQAQIATAGIPGSPDYRLRVPSAVRDAIDLVATCGFTLNNVPVGRFNAAVQLPAYRASDISLSGCPAPTVVSAVATSSTTVQVTFTRRLLPGSVAADGSQFSFDNGLTALAASVNGRVVMVTTSSQTGSTSYTVTVAPTAVDLLGAPLGTPNTAVFTGFLSLAVVRINELNANISFGCDLIELRVISGGSMGGFALRERDTNPPLVTFSSGFTVATNAIIVVHMNSPSSTCNPSGATQEITSTTEQPSFAFVGNYDTAYDWWSSDTGLTNTDNVFTLYDGIGSIVDAVFVANAPTGTAAAATETQAALVAAANQWQMVGGGIPPGGFIDDAFRMHAALDLDATGTTASGVTIQRLDDTDDNDKNDWNSGIVTTQPQTWGLLNAGQAPQP